MVDIALKLFVIMTYLESGPFSHAHTPNRHQFGGLLVALASKIALDDKKETPNKYPTSKKQNHKRQVRNTKYKHDMNNNQR